MSLLIHPVIRTASTFVLIAAFLSLTLFPLSAGSRAASKRVRPSNTRNAHSIQAPAHRENEILVRFRQGTSQTQRDILAASHGVRLKKKLKGESTLEKFELTGSADAVSAAMQLTLNSAIEFAEPNFIVKSDQINVIPNDPRFSEQWALRSTGQTGGQYGSDLHVGNAWQITTGIPTTVIAVIDSGIDFTHPDLVNNEWTNLLPINGDTHGWDYVANSGVIRDEQGHGTAIAGIIAAQGNNGTGVSGVMWRASLMSLRVLDNTGTGDVGDAVEAIDYAVARGAQVINLSWGTEAQSIALKDAIDRALRRGVSVVCSAGNNSRNLDDGLEASAYYPASFDSLHLIAVAATDNLDQLKSWSNYGGSHVAIAAPGENILTTQMGGGYWNVSGTSAAAPLVTGVVGLMKSVRPGTNANQTKRAIVDSARPTASLNGKVSGNGVIDASRALLALPGSGNGNGNGNGGQQVRPPTPGFGSGGTGPGGSFDRPAPAQSDTLPGSGNYRPDQIRQRTPAPPQPHTQIQSNLMCGDCEPLSGGGGGENYPSGDPNFGTARMQAGNETGQDGVDLGSRNFNWGIPLVSLPGRAGMDLEISLYYNSLVWTKDGNDIKYNADMGSPAPGFQLGLPRLQQRFYNSQVGVYSYIMVTPSGGRVEMRQVGSSNIYESQDGSYTQLDVTNSSVPIVRTKDGTQMSFTPVTVNSEFRCTQIKDRNGNFISATYNSTDGHLQTITDTLGRVISFSYDTNNNLHAIQQNWSGVTHDWAVFYYGSVLVAPNFASGLLVNGPSNNYVTVLDSVVLDDGSYYKFGYNPSFGQVNRITHYAPSPNPNNLELSHVAYNMDSSANQTDCPRFTQEKIAAAHWNNDQEAITNYNAATDGSWSQRTTPDETIYKEFFATSGWQTGLTTGTEVWTKNSSNEYVRRKWTTTAWTQDNTSLGYQKNPRPYDTSTYDEAGNRRHVDMIYAASYSLPGEIREYSADGSGFGGFIRRTYIDYNLSQAYVDRRILGLVSSVHVVDENNNYVTKTTFDYDRGGEYLVATPQPATQHDATYYGAGFVTGRGNQTDVWRWDVTDINNATKAIREKHIGYNTTGSAVFSRDALNHQTTIAYDDSFSAGLIDLALNKSATQSSDPGWGGPASKAVDGNTDGVWANSSVTHTNYDNQAWWQVDLGSMQQIQSIDVWNRTDCCGERLTNFNVVLLNESAGVVASNNVVGQGGSPTSVQFNATARYVKVQLVGTNYLSLAEVQVWGNRNTFAYPTKVTDGDNFSSTAWYNFDYSATTRTTDPKGASVSTQYDSARRPTRITSLVNNAYKRFVYGDTLDYTLMFETLNTNSQEFYSFTWNDGAGRTHGAGGELPNSSGGYFVQKTVFDVMSNPVQVTKPTEITGAIQPTGDDSGPFIWTSQTYDWKGRPLLTTNPDNTTRENTYGGCGCAGGEVTTARDERGRRRRATKDVLGRLTKLEEMNWNENDGAYSTTTYTYNGRDQITQMSQAGQLRYLNYDGYGRLQSRVTPEQGTTSYSYFADGTTQTQTDARSVTTTFTYNNRHLPTAISYNVSGDPTSKTAVTASVSFGYDAAGNRTSMTDGLGSVSYVYNTLSQMTSETRTFTGLGSFALNYAYNMSGELTSITNPLSAVVGYNYDNAGRPSAVNGSGYAGVSSYVNSITYRAFGMKGMAYANGRNLSLTYDNRMRLTGWDVPGVMGWTYAYDTPAIHEKTSRVAFANNLYDHTLDRSFDYDNVGRLWASHTGVEGRAHAGYGSWTTPDGPYAENYSYDQLGNITWRNGWGAAGAQYTYSPSHANNKMTVNPFSGGSMLYDAAGNFTGDGTVTYDATGQQVSYPGGPTQSYDGDSLREKKVESGATTYYLRSTVLGGQVVCELNSSGAWTRGYVYLGGQMVGIQYNNSVTWVHQDPITKSQRITDSSGTITSTVDVDPWGGETGRSSNQTFQPHRFTSYERDADGGDDAMMRRYGSYWSRFSQADPFSSYDLTDPQSFNRYAYAQNDPVNFQDPTGLIRCLTCPDEPLTPPIWWNWSRLNGGRNGGRVVIPHYVVEPHERLHGEERTGGHNGNSGREGYVNQDVLSECVSLLFNVTLTSFTPSRPGHGGTFTGTGPLSILGGRNGEISIYNNVTAMSTRDLRALSDRVRRLNGRPLLAPGEIVLGYSPGWLDHTNYSARDQTPQMLVETQVHELAHTINGQISHPIQGEAGEQLERCIKDRGGFTRN